MVFPIMFFLILLQFFILHTASASSWQTLSGKPPVVIARGGFSGVFPDSCSKAYELVSVTTLLNVPLWCDLQLTKDGVGICFPNLNLYNDLAYEKAVKDGVDILDCSVHMSKDKIPFCMSSIDLLNTTNVFDTSFRNLSSTVADIQPKSGIYTFSLTMPQIKTLKRIKIDDIITDFPATTARYRKSQCYREMGMFRTGELLPFANPRLLSPAQSPYPSLVESDVMEPPLHDVRSKQPPASTKAMAKAIQVFSPVRTMAVLVIFFISV